MGAVVLSVLTYKLNNVCIVSEKLDISPEGWRTKINYADSISQDVVVVKRIIAIYRKFLIIS